MFEFIEEYNKINSKIRTIKKLISEFNDCERNVLSDAKRLVNLFTKNSVKKNEMIGKNSFFVMTPKGLRSGHKGYSSNLSTLTLKRIMFDDEIQSLIKMWCLKNNMALWEKKLSPLFSELNKFRIILRDEPAIACTISINKTLDILRFKDDNHVLEKFDVKTIGVVTTKHNPILFFSNKENPDPKFLAKFEYPSDADYTDIIVWRFQKYKKMYCLKSLTPQINVVLDWTISSVERRIKALKSKHDKFKQKFCAELMALKL